MIVNVRSPLELRAAGGNGLHVAVGTSSVTVVTMVCFCRLIVVPDSVEAKFAVQTALVPELATESAPGAATAMATESELVFVPSETVSVNVSVVPVDGATNVGVAVVAPVRVTAGLPAV